MCTKYINPHGTLFLKCDKINTGKPFAPSYFKVLDESEYYEEHINFCMNCGEKLVVLVSRGGRLVPEGE